MNAKIFLKQAKKIDYMIRNKLIEVEQWRTIAKKTTASFGDERVQSSGNQQQMETAIAIFTDIEREIIEDVKTLRDTKKDISKVIEKLENEAEYELLHKHYIQYIELPDIAVMEGKSYSNITTRHKRALKNVQAILDGRNSRT